MLGQCWPWHEAAHVVLLRVPSKTETAGKVERADARGAVRDIRIGEATGRDGRYPYCLIVTLASSAAVAAFQGHHAVRALAGKAASTMDTSVLAREFAEL